MWFSYLQDLGGASRGIFGGGQSRDILRGGPVKKITLYNQYLIASNPAPLALSKTQKTFLDGRHKATKLRAQEDLINGLDGSGSWLVAPPPYHAYLVAKPSYCC